MSIHLLDKSFVKFFPKENCGIHFDCFFVSTLILKKITVKFNNLSGSKIVRNVKTNK